MLKSSVNIHSWAYFITLIIIAASIPLSKYVMSMGAFMLVTMWLWAGFSFKISARFFKLGGYFYGIFHLLAYIFQLAYRNLIDKLSLFFKNKAAMVLTSIYLLHIIGVFYTEDLDYAMKDFSDNAEALYSHVFSLSIGLNDK